MVKNTEHIITPEQAGTIPELFLERVTRTPDALAYRYHDDDSETWKDLSWSEMSAYVSRWRAALASEKLCAGDRVAVIMQNCPEWIMFDQAALANGLVVVPLYTQDRADNVAYILKNAGVKLLLLGGQEHWDSISPVLNQLDSLQSIISVNHINLTGEGDHRLKTSGEWLPDEAEPGPVPRDKDALATIVYTSGTTGRPKGVKLSHYNILWDAYGSIQIVNCLPDYLFLSFLPLSHTLERTAGYYLPMMAGAAVAFNRSIPQLADDLIAVSPTIMISVPRIFERVYNKIHTGLEEKSPVARYIFESAVNVGWRRFEYQQKRAKWTPALLFWPLLKLLVANKVMEKLGGKLDLVVVGGAPLPFNVARLFLALGLPMVQGYGLTETSPVISVNPIDNNDPQGVGVILEGIEARFSEQDELQVRSPAVMQGYWDNDEATADIIDSEGWLHTGDKAKLENGQLYITGRLKEIIVLANGEKVSPADMEMAICRDQLFEQSMVVGEGKPFLVALLVLSRDLWSMLAKQIEIDPDDDEACNSSRVNQIILERVAKQLASFPGYARVRAISCQLDPWTIEDGLITPTLKLKRNKVSEKYSHFISEMYRDH